MYSEDGSELYEQTHLWTDVSEQFCETDKPFQRKDMAQKNDSIHLNEQSY